MEAAALNPWLARAVWLAIPPAAREAVAGDLWECCATPRDYLREALCTVPFVIASQMRRNLNLPVLLLQAALVCFCLGAGAAALTVPFLMLREAYRPAARPSHRGALRETVVVAFGGLVVLQAISLGMQLVRPHSISDGIVWLQLFFISPALLPLLCLLRTGLIMDGDRRPGLADRLSRDDLVDAYRVFLRRVRRRALLEGFALMATAALMAGVFGRPALVTITVYALVGCFLLLQRPRHIPQTEDFVSLGARFRLELAAQQQLRRFLWWLWLAPLMVDVYARLVKGGLAAGHPATVILGGAGTLMLCFLVAALNREHGGRVQEDIGRLDRMRESDTCIPCPR